MIARPMISKRISRAFVGNDHLEVGGDYVRVGIEAGPLSQWLENGLIEADMPVVCVETLHMKVV